MELFWIEGLYVTKQALKHARKRGGILRQDIEPFAKSFWAESVNEALEEARGMIGDGKWVEGPSIVKTSEEDRMRELGAPTLPGVEK